MNGGASGLEGYVYQQDYLALRALASVAATAIADQALRPIQSFVIEGRASGDGPIWDLILGYHDTKEDLLECKDTAIGKDDRKIFYSRVRSQVHSGIPPNNLRIGWVTDPAKQGNILLHLAGMQALLHGRQLVVPDAAPERVASAEDALQEALYYLSRPNDPNGTKPIPVDVAAELLRSLVLEEWSIEALRDSVTNLATGVFKTGTGEILRQHIRGQLTTLIVEKGVAKDTLDGFLSRIGTQSVLASVSGSLRKLLEQYSAAAYYQPRITPIEWDRLPNTPRKEWSLSQRLPDYNAKKSCVLIAQQGVGKTVAATQAFNVQLSILEKHHVIRVDAGLLEPEFLDNLIPYFAILCGLGPTWLAIDGLDAIDRDTQKAWQRTIERLHSFQNLILFVTAREEVLEAGEWLQRLTTTFPSLILKPLDIDQVADAFREVGLRAPQNASLLAVLRNPFLLSLYAKIATVADMPLEMSGEVTAFRVIKAFWSRRVCSPSQGHRLVGAEQASLGTKREAVRYLTEKSLSGMLVIQRPHDNQQTDDGIQMLIREGVLLPQGTHSVRWLHDWLREFAMIDFLVSRIDQPGAQALAKGVFALGDTEKCPDHVVRSASIGGAKWIAMERDSWGRIEEYLAALHELHKGLASEALATMMEGSQASVSLAELPGQLLLEAIQFARAMRAPQWSDQITSMSLAGVEASLATSLHRLITDYEMEVVARG